MNDVKFTKLLKSYKRFKINLREEILVSQSIRFMLNYQSITDLFIIFKKQLKDKLIKALICNSAKKDISEKDISKNDIFINNCSVLVSLHIKNLLYFSHVFHLKNQLIIKALQKDILHYFSTINYKAVTFKISLKHH